MMVGFCGDAGSVQGEGMKLKGYFLLVVLLAVGNIPSRVQKRRTATPNRGELEKMAARFAATPLRVDVTKLSPGDGQALVKLIEAGRVLNDVFLKQSWNGNPALYARLQKDRTPLGKARQRYFWINKGPWSRIDEFKAFLPGVPPRKPLGANFYPEDMTKEEFEHWLASLPEKERDVAKSFFTVIRRKTDGGGSGHDRLTVVSYNEEYNDDLVQAAKLLREAAGLTDNASLRKFLNLRAEALLSNDYYESDMAWMDLDAPLDITIGPYETYEDELFGYKAAFEAYVSLRNEGETARLIAFTQHLQQIEDNLPIDPQYRNPKLGAAAPIRVVDEILSAGDGNRGIATFAYNLPNDDRVVQQKGSKRVLMKNIQEAKFRSALLPVARRTLSKSVMLDVNFESFFTHTMAHELMHGLGPHQIKVQGRDTTSREELKELFSAIEEAKADVTGLFALQYMMDHAKEMGLARVLPSDDAAQRQLYTTYLASMLRTIRFGLNEAHGKGMAVQLNVFMNKGAIVEHEGGTYAVNMDKVKQAVRDLAHDLLTLEAEGNYAGAKKMLDEMGIVRPELQKTLDGLQGIPTDIEPIFVTAEELAPPVKQQPAKPSRKKLKKKRPRG